MKAVVFLLFLLYHSGCTAAVRPHRVCSVSEVVWCAAGFVPQVGISAHW